MAALIAEERSATDLYEADVSAALAERLVDLSVVVSASSWTEVERRASEAFVHAIRATGAVPLMGADDHITASDTGEPLASVQSTELVPA